MFIHKIDTRPIFATALFIILGASNNVHWLYYLLVFFYFLAFEFKFKKV